MVIKQVQ